MRTSSRLHIFAAALRILFLGSAGLSLFLSGLGAGLVQAAGITLVQHVGKDAGITSSSSLAFPTNNTAGNWIAVCIRAGKSGQVFTVTDSNGNIYRSAFQFNVTADTPNGDTIGIFYAENIAGGTNTVTVSESISSNTLRFAILEYLGVATANSFDTAIGSQGTGTSPNSTSATTTANGDLLLGMIVTANGRSYIAGSGFVVEDRVPASPNTKLITEDQVQSTAGPASASASLSSSDIWGAVLAAFKAASAGPVSPSITSLSPTSGGAGASVTITGSNFGSTQGSSTVTFNGVSAGVANSWSPTSITVQVPTAATSGPVVVTVGGLPSNGVSFVTGPISVSIAPTSPTMTVNSAQPFNATVQFDSRNLGVSWTLSGTGCAGAACGTLSNATAASVTYTAPATVPSPANVTVLATSVADNTKSAAANVTIAPPPPISVSVSPSAPTVPASGSQPLNATVQNDPSGLGVSWTLSGAGCSGAACGTLSSITPTSVIYTAPSVAPAPPNVTVTATSVADNTKSAVSSITIGPPTPISVSVSPSSRTVSINLTQAFTATLQNDSSNLGVTWSLSGAGCSGAACGVLSNATSTSVTYTAPSTVPSPATVTLTGTSVADTTKSGSATITVSQGIPTSLGWYQIPNTLLQPVCPNIPQIQGAVGCQGVISAWNGGIADTTRNRLLFTGGGHMNYWGNEVYSLNLTDLTLTRINDPVFPSSIPGCTEDWGSPPARPSTPAARENYSGLAYVPHLDKLWLFGGALGTSGCRSTGMWMLDLPTLTWQRMDPYNGSQETVYTDINYADYDPQTKLVYVYIANNDVLASYNPDTNTMTELLNHKSYGTPSYANGVLDPKRHWFFIFGAGMAQYYDLTRNPPAVHRFSSQTVGCSGIQSMNYPGLAYDPVQDKIVGWAGGNTVYVFDQTTFACTAVTYPNGPAAQQANGTYGRWRYFPALNLFALVNDWKQNAFSLRLTPAP